MDSAVNQRSFNYRFYSTLANLKLGLKCESALISVWIEPRLWSLANEHHEIGTPGGHVAVDYICYIVRQ